MGLFDFNKKAAIPQRAEPSLFRDIAGGMTTSSGVSVGAESAMRNMTVLSCARVLRESVALLPCHTLRVFQGKKSKAEDTRLYQVLHRQPNAYQTPFQFFEMIMDHLVMRGDFFGYITRNSEGRIQEILPIHPDKIEVKQDDAWGVQYYLRRNGKDEPIDRSRLLHIVGLCKNGDVRGRSVIGYAADAVGFAIAAERHASAFFKNGARPGSILKHPGQISADAGQRLKEQFEAQHGGVDNHFRTLLLEEGMGFEPVTMSMEDAQYIEIRKFQRQEICAAFRVPPHKVADLERATFSNIEQQGIEFLTDSLMPWVRRIEEAMERDLLLERAPDGKGGFVNEKALFQIRFNVNALMRGDTQQRYASYAIARQWGWLSVNDIRALEDMNPVEGGDTYLSPMNMTPADQLGKPTESAKKSMEILERLVGGADE